MENETIENVEVTTTETTPAPETLLATPDIETKTEESTEVKTEEDTFDWVPKKFMRDGKPDFKALEKARSNLEKKLGQKGVSLAPESIDEYDFKLETFQTDDEVTNTFKQEALEAGLSKQQYEFVMKKYEANIGNFINTPEKASKVLKETWGDDYNENMALAFKAFDAVVPSDISLNDIGNDPKIIKILAAIGRDLGEDTSVRAPSLREPVITQKEIEALMMTPEYHQAGSETRNKVTNWFKNQK